MSDPVRRGALASYLGGVAVLLTAWFAGWSLHIWPAVPAFLGRRYSIALPLWLWLLLLLAGVVSVRRWLCSRASQLRAEAVSATNWPQLDELESSIMSLFVQRDGAPVSYTDLLSRNDVPNLRLSKAVERLQEFGLVNRPLDSIHLTRHGRDFLLDSNARAPSEAR